MNRFPTLASVAAIVLVIGSPAVSAGPIVYSNDQPGFATATSGRTLLGVETFEQSTLSPVNLAALADPLTQGASNGPFPSGLVAPVTVQSNTLGGAPAVPNPKGAAGLYTATAAFFGFTSDHVGAGLDSSSLDLIFDPTEQVTAVGLTPLVNTGSSFADAPAVFEFRIYDPANTLISSGTASGNRSGTYFFGAVTTGGEIIGRINLFAPVGGIAVDNIQVFNGPVAQPVPIPEPSGVLLAWMSVVTLACSIRLRQRPTL